MINQKLFFLLTLFTLSLIRLNAITPPDWINSAINVTIPEEYQNADAVLLLDKQEITYEINGTVTWDKTRVIKILNENGGEWANFKHYYSGPKPLGISIELWVFHPNQKPERFTERDFIDIEADSDLYTERRILSNTHSQSFQVGDVYVFQLRDRRKRTFAEGPKFFFNHEIPVINSSFTITIPDSWNLRYEVLNPIDEIKRYENSNCWKWEGTHIAPITEERSVNQSVAKRLATLCYTTEPKASNETSFPLLSFTSWENVAEYLYSIAELPVQASEKIQAKALDLTLNDSTDLERIESIARFVQKVNYSGIAIDLEKGGGYTPRKSDEVLDTYFGDCKDKTNLMRSLLRAIGITAYPIICLSNNDIRKITPQWPSPSQFNHCIIAVKHDPVPDWPAALRHEELGNLLIFDPTDSLLHLGGISNNIQGEDILIAANVHHPLVKMPRLKPKENAITTEIYAHLDANGLIRGKMERLYRGNNSHYIRRKWLRLNKNEFEKSRLEWLQYYLRSAKMENLSFKEDQKKGEASMSLTFSADNYARSIGGRLLVFQPSLVSRSEWLGEEDANRVSDIKYSGSYEKDVIVIQLPEGYSPDELPTDVDIDTDFSSIICTTRIEDNQLIFTREYTTKPVTLDASRWEEVRDFNKALAKAEAATVVLLKH